MVISKLRSPKKAIRSSDIVMHSPAYIVENIRKKGKVNPNHGKYIFFGSEMDAFDYWQVGGPFTIFVNAFKNIKLQMPKYVNGTREKEEVCSWNTDWKYEELFLGSVKGLAGYKDTGHNFPNYYRYAISINIKEGTWEMSFFHNYHYHRTSEEDKRNVVLKGKAEIKININKNKLEVVGILHAGNKYYASQGHEKEKAIMGKKDYVKCDIKKYTFELSAEEVKGDSIVEGINYDFRVWKIADNVNLIVHRTGEKLK